MSRQYFNSISPSRDANDEILEKNNFKKGTSILSNLYRIDDRSKWFTEIFNPLFSNQV